MKALVIFFLAAVGTFIVDQGIKEIFVAGYDWQSDCISLELHYNNGVAFNMLAFMGSYLKWVQALFIAAIAIYLFRSSLVKHFAFPLGLLLGGAIGNLYDRFIHGGVVDYLYWHCWFHYPVFNYADVMVLVAVAWVILVLIFDKDKRDAF